ncbi:MAG: hypothetical protein ACJ73D_10475 [Pyrinomonadaceae bacterium]
MFRIIARIAVGLVLISNTFAQSGAEEPPYMGLSGLIHTVHEESYNCTGDPAEKPWRVNEVTYDRRGNVIWRAYFNPDGSVGNQASFTFDSDGNKTGWAEFYGKNDFPPEGLHQHAVFTLSGGKPISAIVYREDTPEFKTTWEYDERGNKVREATVELAGQATTTRTYKYDVQNRQIENTYDSNGLSSVQRRTYDAAGNVISESQYDRDNLLGTTTRLFEGGRLIKEVTTLSDGSGRTTLNTYNKDGNLILTTIDDASITSRTIIEYYAIGRIRSREQMTVAKTGGPPQNSEASPRPGRNLEKYDSKGNQIERYIYDVKGELYLTQLSSYDDRGKAIRLIETSRAGSMYDSDLVYEHDSHGNQIGAFCRKVTPTGEVNLYTAEKRVITYYDK